MDGRDVSVWVSMAHVALHVHNLPLARVALEAGLTANPYHRPCIDLLILVHHNNNNNNNHPKK